MASGDKISLGDHRLPLAILGGVLSATPYFLLATPSLGGMLLTYFATLPLFAVGLGLGFSDSLRAAGAGILCSFLFSITSGNFGFCVPYIIFNVIPTILILYQTLQSRKDAAGKFHFSPAPHVVNGLTGIALVLCGASFLVFHVSFAQAGHDFSTLLQDAMGHQPPETLLVMMKIVNFLPGIVALSWAAMALVNGVLAQGLLKAFGYNVRPSPDICDVYPFSFFYYLLAILGVMTILPLGVLSLLASNLLLPALLPFFLTGLGTVHAIARKFPYTPWILVGFYPVAFFLTWPLYLLLFLGILEPWLKLRNRFI